MVQKFLGETNPGYDEASFWRWAKHPDHHIIIMWDEDKAVGYVAFNQIASIGQDYIFIQQAFVMPKVSGLFLFLFLKEISKKLSLPLLFNTDRNPAAWKRKYGFVKTFTLMELPLGENNG